MPYYDINPIGKPRMTQRDKWRKSHKRYYAFAGECRLKNVFLPSAGAKVIFHIPMPKSWSKHQKQKLLGTPHQQKPDLDNLLKALADALYDDDCVIFDVHVRKVWAETGGIEIEF